jgi:hypothetical protein
MTLIVRQPGDIQGKSLAFSSDIAKDAMPNNPRQATLN